MSGDFEIQRVSDVHQSILRVFLIERAYLVPSHYHWKMII